MFPKTNQHLEAVLHIFFFDGKVLWQAALCLVVLGAVGTKEQGRQCGPWEGGLGGGRLQIDR